MSSAAPDRQVVHLASEADENGLIVDRTWENAVILGPAVVVPQEDVTLDFNTFVVEPDGLFIEVPEGRSFQGAIGLRRVTFRRCELRNVAIAGTPKVIAELKKEFEFPDEKPTTETSAPLAAAGRSSA